MGIRTGRLAWFRRRAGAKIEFDDGMGVLGVTERLAALDDQIELGAAVTKGPVLDRKSVVEGNIVDIRGRRIN